MKATVWRDDIYCFHTLYFLDNIEIRCSGCFTPQIQVLRRLLDSKCFYSLCIRLCKHTQLIQCTVRKQRAPGVSFHLLHDVFHRILTLPQPSQLFPLRFVSFSMASVHFGNLSKFSVHSKPSAHIHYGDPRIATVTLPWGRGKRWVDQIWADNAEAMVVGFLLHWWPPTSS